MPKEQAAPGLVPMVAAVHERLVGAPPRDAHVAFYPYVSTKSTIRDRDGRLLLRISDHLRDAPDAVLRGLMAVLVGRLRRVPAGPAPDVDAYHAWVHGREAQSARQATRHRGRKHIDPVGDHRSLLESYLRVAMETGLHVDDPPRLSWSKTASRRRFGHHDPAHGCIVLSRVLDDPRVPEFVLDYVVYHELLHIVHPPIQGAGRKRIVHHKAFRDAEAKFPRRDEAEAWLTRLARPA